MSEALSILTMSNLGFPMRVSGSTELGLREASTAGLSLARACAGVGATATKSLGRTSMSLPSTTSAMGLQ